MDSEAFRIYGKQMIDIVADYWESMRERKPLPDVQPGFMKDLIPSEPPIKGEEWKEIFKDIESVALQGNTNWHHPHFFAYFPTALSYPSIMADILSGGIASIGFSWKSSPSMTELEMAMTDWLIKAFQFPTYFLNSDDGHGAGIIQNTASDATLVAILSARARAVKKISDTLRYQSSSKNINNEDNVILLLKNNITSIFIDKLEILKKKIIYNTNGKECNENILENNDITTFEAHNPSLFEKLVAYCSDQAHSSIDKGAMLAGVRLRKLKSSIDNKTKNYTINSDTLKKAIQEDINSGLVPFILIATVGTTNTCAVDPLSELGPICNENNIWLHVDGAYAISFALLPECKYLINGIEYADSFNFNVHKAMAVNFDCSPMWFKDASEAIAYFNVDPVYLKHEHQTNSFDYRHLQIALGRRFRSLKLWFVFRNMGIEGLQKFLRKQIELGDYFHDILIKDNRFEIIVPHHLGLTCFKIKDSTNEINERLYTEIDKDRRIHLVPSKINGIYFLRFVVCSQLTTKEDILFAYNVIVEIYNKIIQ
ncbi:Aromatic-L-amino-acid decarboxylase [Strongyloides ratti]|uniref:Aromatic-L-amino-acid decarboxylase n=1 Tax=Strongyloides ratti TaxID=34506 RepID=A0A090LCX2_STRRB|nr:Aromatic-L-amino-acid decarboxylase [Strongyloides ratti]CEF65355.1 Aromatic-L-amino-acid decarboxylase [Strongyloides ratti]